MSKNKINENAEIRNLGIVEMRMADDADESRTVVGYAATFNQWADFRWMKETIVPGAFKNALVNSDCRALFNHDSSQLLAREKSQTLKLEEDEKGLKYQFDIPVTRDDILEMIKRGDLSECSFQFTIKKQRWVFNDDGPDQRYIEEIDTLYDIAPVTFPAYPNTELALRYKQELQSTDNQTEIELKAQERERELTLMAHDV